MVVRPGSISRVVSTADYLPVLDGLRAVSILLVVVSHLGLDHVVPGALGVTLFFFISGFLITRQLAGGLALHGRIDFAGFYLRRALRLMPALLVYAGITGLAYVAAGGRISPAGWMAALFYGANYYDLWAGYRTILPGVRHPFNILWSLAIEEHFYALWPASLALLWRGRYALAGAVTLCAVVLIWRLWLWDVCFVPGAPAVCGPENPNPLWRFNRLYLATDTRIDSMAWGAILALKPGPGTGVRAAGGATLLALSFALPGALGRHVMRPSVQGLALLGIVPWLLHGETRLHRTLRSAPARLIGRLSYSLYLWHWAALGVADRLFHRFSMPWVLVAVPLSALLACASYYGIERPMLGVRRRFGSHAPG
jgi:peptidoglycan/LPS O-acetylase OafA/YrhL